MNELEAKYLIAAGRKPVRVLRRLLQELSWAGYLAHPRGTSEIVDEYFDTPDWRLCKAGWSYRLRATEDGLRITLKQLAKQRSNVFEREEIEQHLFAPLHQPGTPPPGPVAERLSGMLGPNLQLRPLFSQRNCRQTYHLSHPDHPHAHVELALDRVQVETDPPMSYGEIEFELHEGPVNALQDLTGVMEQQHDLIPARVSKFQRGLFAAGLEPPSSEVWRSHNGDIYGKWLEVALPHLHQLRKQLKQQEPFAWEAVHVEGVHQLRVTTRRIRAALRAFANVLPKKAARRLRADIQWLTKTLGPVRDLDVQLENLQNYRATLPDAQGPALNRYQLHLERDRRAAHARLLHALASNRFIELDEHFDRMLAKATRKASADWGISTQQAASDQVLPLLKDVLRKGSAIKAASPAAKLHKLRIQIKRLRYQLEFLLTPYGTPARKTLKALTRLQDSLGAFQDANVALDHLQTYCQHTNLDRIERRTFKLLMAKEREDAAVRRQQYAKCWSRFEKRALRLQNLL